MDNNRRIAIQDTYGERFQHCWGCGPKNDSGLHIRSYPSEDGTTCICRYTPSPEFTGGVPLNLYGGMIAMLFDCHGGASAAWFNFRSKGLDLTEETVIHRYITARLEIDFKKPIPIEEEITITARAEEIDERKVIVLMDMKCTGELRASARMVAVRVKDSM